MLLDRLGLVELGRELLARPLTEGLLDKPAGIPAECPAKPRVVTVVSPLGVTMTSIIFTRHLLGPGS